MGRQQARRGEFLYHSASREIMRLSENARLPFGRPFDGLTVLSKVEGITALSNVEGLRYPRPPPC